MRFSPGILLAAACALLPRLATSGAWPVGDGEGQYMVKIYHYAADEAFDPNYDWKRYDIQKYRNTGIEIFAEYGVGDGFTVGGNQFFTRAVKNGLRNKTDVANEQIGGGRYFIRKTVFDPVSKYVIGAVQLEAEFPGFRSGEGDGSATLGHKKYGWALKGLYGKKLWRKYLRLYGLKKPRQVERFINIEAGFGQRFDADDMSLSNGEFRYMAEFTEGYEISPYFLWSQTFFDFAANSKRDEGDVIDGNYDLVTQRFTLGRHIDESLSLAVGAAFPLGGRDIVAGNEINLQLWRRF